MEDYADFVTIAAVVLIVLSCVIAYLYLDRKSKPSQGDARTPNAKAALPEGEIGTVFIKEEDGRVVRRSTRQHKPVTPLGDRLAAAASDGDTPAKRGSRTPRASGSRTPRSPAAGAEPVTPRSTRGRGRPRKSDVA